MDKEALKLAQSAFKEIASETYDPWTNGAKAQRIAEAALPIIEQALAAPTVQEPVALEEYDAGLLNDYGGGKVEWWQDYIRAELGRAYEHYQSQITPPAAPVQKPKFVYITYVNHREVDKASVFDLNNPPVAHNPSLCKNTSCLYVTPEGEVFYWDRESEIYRHRSEPVQTEATPAQPKPELVSAMAQILGDRLAKEQAVYLSMETAKSFVKSMLTAAPEKGQP